MHPDDQQRSSDETAVRRLYAQLMEGWNQGSGDAFAAVFTEDGDLVAFDGTHVKGRHEIAVFHQPLFDKWLKGTRLVGDVTAVRFLCPTVAVMHARGGTIMRGKSTPARERESIQTLVAVKGETGWRIAAFQNTRFRPIGREARGTLLWLLTDLLWRWMGPRYRSNPDDA